MSGFTLHDMPNLAGKHILVTGATSGIGLESAAAFAAAGAMVTLTGRSDATAAAARAAILARVPNATITSLAADFSRLASVRDLAARLVADGKTIDVLMNNAGTLGPKAGPATTADGFELMWGVNFLAPFALTALLWPLLLKAPAPRVVTIASNAHKRGRIDFDDLQSTKQYRPMKAYSQAKLADLIFALELDRRCRAASVPVMSVAAHPGLAMTMIIDKAGVPLVGLLKVTVGRIIGHSQAAGALPGIFAAVSPDAKPGGYYGPQGRNEMRGPVGEASIMPHAQDTATATQLWEVAETMTGVKFMVS